MPAIPLHFAKKVGAGMSLVTVRIPELNEHSNLSNSDRVPIWSNEDNKTRYARLDTLRNFIETGDNSTVPISIDGGVILYVVPASAEGGDVIDLPQIAGKNFRLSRDGYPMQRDIEFEVRSAGGAKLLDTTLIEGQRYEFFLYEYMIGVPPQPGGDSDTSGGFIKGSVTINTNVNISPSDICKVHKIRGGSNALTIGLPDIEQCPENSFIILECLISNSKQHAINTVGGQYIYIDNDSKTKVYIGKGEKLFLYRDTDGWYDIAGKINLNNLAQPKAAYKVGMNQVLCDGSLINRADYPRLWEYVQTLGSSLVDDSVWQTASATVAGRTVSNPYRGCFSRGNGTTTFRLPDLMNVALRGVKNIGGADNQRHYNYPGGFQRHEFAEHNHQMTFVELPNSVSGNPGYDGGSNQYDQNTTKTTTSVGGAETRMDNVGVLWVIDY